MSNITVLSNLKLDLEQENLIQCCCKTIVNNFKCRYITKTLLLNTNGGLVTLLICATTSNKLVSGPKVNEFLDDLFLLDHITMYHT